MAAATPPFCKTLASSMEFAHHFHLMEGQTSWENPLELMPLNSSLAINDVFNGSPSDCRPYLMVEDRRVIEHQLSALYLPRWIYGSKSRQDYFDFLAEDSKFVGNNIPRSLVVSGLHTANSNPEIQMKLYNHSGNAFGFQSADSSLSVDSWRSKIGPYLLENGNPDDSSDLKHSCHNVNPLKPYIEEEQRNNFAGPSNHPSDQTHISRKQVVADDNFSHLHLRKTATVEEDITLNKPASLKRQRAYETDRLRRLRIGQRLNELQELLPYSVEGSQASVMGEVIDYIKYLQLQLKDLSRNRLGGEPTSAPLVFVEGYGHYVFEEKMRMNEPLEETMGKLLETNPAVATLLLKSRGLSVMSFPSTQGSTQETQVPKAEPEPEPKHEPHYTFQPDFNLSV